MLYVLWRVGWRDRSRVGSLQEEWLPLSRGPRCGPTIHMAATNGALADGNSFAFFRRRQIEKFKQHMANKILVPFCLAVNESKLFHSRLCS